MNLDEFKAYVLSTREASRLNGLSVLAATISTQPEKKEGNK